jgi:hypothetical protein
VEHIADLLCVNKTLRYVDLRGNIIGDEGALCLAKAIQANSTLQVLVLGGNRIGDEGGLRLVNAAVESPSLQLVTLANNKITPKAKTAIVGACAKRAGLRCMLEVPRGSLHRVRSKSKIEAAPSSSSPGYDEVPKGDDMPLQPMDRPQPGLDARPLSQSSLRVLGGSTGTLRAGVIEDV